MGAVGARVPSATPNQPPISRFEGKKGLGDEGQGEGDGERNCRRRRDRAGEAPRSRRCGDGRQRHGGNRFPGSYRSETSLLWLLQLKKQTGGSGSLRKK